MDRRRLKADLRKTSKGGGPVAVYARMMLAIMAGKGMRVSRDDLMAVMLEDHATLAALEAELIDLYEDGNPPYNTFDLRCVDIPDEEE